MGRTGRECGKNEERRERRGKRSSPLGRFTLSQFLLGPSSCGQTLPTGACSHSNLLTVNSPQHEGMWAGQQKKVGLAAVQKFHPILRLAVMGDVI